MNKKEVMRQSSMELLIPAAIESLPGIASQRLYDLAKEWAGKSWYESDTFHFEQILLKLREEGKYRCTNKQWYPRGHVAERQVKGPHKEDPRQVRMDW